MGKSFFLSFTLLFYIIHGLSQAPAELAVSDTMGSKTGSPAGPIKTPAVKIVITEIMYNPPESGTDSLEYIELYNDEPVALNLRKYYFSEGVTFTFPDFMINSNEFVLIAKNASAIASTFGVMALQWTSGSLSNSGELIRLKDSLHFTIDSVHYGNALPWDPLANGHGPSLELCDPESDNSNAQNWTHALEYAATNNAGDTIWASPLSGCIYLPVADFYSPDTLVLVGDLVQFTDSSSGVITSWDWEFEGGSPSIYNGQNPPPVTYNSMGNFDVRLTVSNISGQDYRLKKAYIRVGMTTADDISGNNEFLLSPNPNDGKFSLTRSCRSAVDFKIISSAGILVLKGSGKGKEINIDISNFNEGIYLLQATDLITGKQITKKIIFRR